MTDRMERAVQRIATKKNGSAKTIDDVFEVILALADDTDENHEESVQADKRAEKAVIQMQKLLGAHCVEAQVRDSRIDELEAAVGSCPDRWEASHKVTHAAHLAELHAKPRRENDPPDSEFLEKRETAFPATESFETRVMWWIGGKVYYFIMAVLIIVITIALNYIWFGKP